MTSTSPRRREVIVAGHVGCTSESNWGIDQLEPTTNRRWAIMGCAAEALNPEPTTAPT